MVSSTDLTPTPAQIRAARAAAGLTQKQAGELIWCTARTWQDWERGERRMMPVIWWAWQQRAYRSDSK